MHIRITTDPVSFHEIDNTAGHPCHYEGDGDNGIEIYFDNEDNMNTFLEWQRDDDHRITLTGNSSDDYIAEG